MPDGFGNPMYQMLPTTPPGLDGLRYTIGGPVAQLMGGMMAPYVPVNQSVFDARVAAFQNDPLYRSMMAGVSAQMFGQMGSQLAAMPLAQNLASMAGYGPAEFKQAMANGPSAFGRSFMGSAVMPLVDAAMAGAGITNGSYVQAAQAMYNNRMAFLSPGVRINAFDPLQQHQAMSGAAAMMNSLNGLMSGNGVTPNYAVTQGFGREQVADWVTRAATFGAYNANGVGYTARLREATGGKDKYGLDFDIKNLDWAKGDFTGGGPDSNLSASQAEKVRKVQDEVNNTNAALIQVMGAMRDMLKTTDGTFEKLMAMTNGEAFTSRANMRQATESVRRLDAVTKAYNLDPTQTWNRMMQNRALLQDAAGFDETMRFYGFDGGGMFRLGAQTELMATVEDAITARGIRGNPVLENRYRNQATQAFARNMNTQAGAMSSLLAYARQTGMVSEEDALGFREGLTSGDRSVMEDTINRLLVTTFGSKERGRQFMQDATFVNSMRQSMDDRAGAFANQTIIRGADNEMARRERITLAENRLAFSRSALRSAGVSAIQTDEGVGLIVDSIVGELNGKEAGVGDAFRAEYERRIANGEKALAAQQATVASFKRDPVYGKYAETIATTVKDRSALNNERRVIDLGPEGFQAKRMAEQLHRSGLLTGERYGALSDRLRKGDRLETADVLSELDGIVSELDTATQNRFAAIRASGEREYNAAVDTITSKRTATSFVDRARQRGFGADKTVDAYNAAITALKDYAETGGRSSADYDALADALGKSGFSAIYGKEGTDDLLAAAKNGYAVDKETGKQIPIARIIEQMGRASFDIKQVATSTLTKNGWGAGMSGFWGGGFYAGNKEAFLQDRDALLDRLANGIQDDAVKHAGDRSTLAQDFLSLMESGDPKKLLRLYDADGNLEKAIGSDYFTQFKRVEDLRAGADAAHDTFAETIKQLRDEGKYAKADTLVQMINDAGKKNVLGDFILGDDDFEKELAGAGITGDKAKKFMTALGSQRDLSVAEGRLHELSVGAMSRQDVIDGLRGYKASKAAADQDKVIQDKKIADISKFWGGLDHSDVSQFVKEGALRDAYTAMYDVVGDDELKAAFGGVKSLKGFSESALNKKAFEILGQKAASGDKGAIAAMDKMGVAAKEQQAMHVKGEITLKDGKDARPAVLDFILGNA